MSKSGNNAHTIGPMDVELENVNSHESSLTWQDFQHEFQI